jgi:hypothetical protein
MENFKTAEEILASPESLYSIQGIVRSSTLTLLTVHNEMNYKRSVRLKFSLEDLFRKRWWPTDPPSDKFCCHFLWWPKWSVLLSLPQISQTNCTVACLHTQPSLSVGSLASFTNSQGYHKNKGKEITWSSQNIPEGSGSFS